MKLTEDMKKTIIALLSTVGFFERTEKFEPFKIPNIDNHATKVIQSMNNIVLHMGLNDDILNQLVEDVQTGVYTLDVFTNQELVERKKRRLKSRTLADKESIWTVVEVALGLCKGCDRNKKACALRKAFLKLEIPTFHNVRGYCEYNQDVDG